MVAVEVPTWEPNSTSGKPLLCLHEKQVPFVQRYIDMGVREPFARQKLISGSVMQLLTAPASA